MLYFVAVSFSYPCAGCSSAEPTYVSLNAATMIGSWSEVKLIAEIHGGD
jgi:ABC-type Co2+ transport system permease subunit